MLCAWIRITINLAEIIFATDAELYVVTKGLKSMHHADAYSPSVILVFGYLMHRKIYEIVIYEYVHDRKLLSHIQGEVM